jgi:hypothetical protein
MQKVLAIGLVALAAGCTAHRTEDGIDIDPVADVIGNWSTTLEPQNNSGISGSATVQSRAAAAKVTVHIMGAASGSVHPWHVHRGTCGNDKGIVGGAGEYKPLTVGTDGMSNAEVNIPVALNEDETYFVNIHKSASDLGTIVSCGALKH